MGAAVTVKGVQIEEKERQAYVDYLEKKHNRKLKTLEIEIDGDYANLVRTDIESADVKLVARALLPEGIDVGTKLKYEMFEYEVI